MASSSKSAINNDSHDPRFPQRDSRMFQGEVDASSESAPVQHRTPQIIETIQQKMDKGIIVNEALVQDSTPIQKKEIAEVEAQSEAISDNTTPIQREVDERASSWEAIDAAAHDKSMAVSGNEYRTDQIAKRNAQDPQYQKRRGMDAAAKESVSTESFQNEQLARSLRAPDAEQFRLMCLDIMKFCECQDGIIDVLNEKEFNIGKWKRYVQAASTLQLLGGVAGVTLGLGAFVAFFPLTGPAAIVGAALAGAAAGISGPAAAVGATVAGVTATAAGAGANVATAGLKQQQEQAEESKTKAAGKEAGKVTLGVAKSLATGGGVTTGMTGGLSGLSNIKSGAKSLNDMRKVNPQDVYDELQFDKIATSLYSDALIIGEFYHNNSESLSQGLFLAITNKMLKTKEKIESYR
jgi:hypothetical protein